MHKSRDIPLIWLNNLYPGTEVPYCSSWNVPWIMPKFNYIWLMDNFTSQLMNTNLNDPALLCISITYCTCMTIIHLALISCVLLCMIISPVGFNPSAGPFYRVSKVRSFINLCICSKKELQLNLSALIKFTIHPSFVKSGSVWLLLITKKYVSGLNTQYTWYWRTSIQILQIVAW